MKQNVPVLETPVKKSSAAVFRHPTTGEVFIPKAIPVTISKPPAAQPAIQAAVNIKPKVEEIDSVSKVSKEVLKSPVIEKVEKIACAEMIM